MPSQPGRTVVLIAEDDVIVRNLVRTVLQEEGYFVLVACDGKEALILSRQYPSTIHALLTDVKMPKLDGLELRQMILEERPGIKVLLMSGYFDSPTGAISILSKPFNADVLRQRIRELLGPSPNDAA